MKNADPEIASRLARAVDELPLDVESRLDAVHGASRAAGRRRRAAALAVGVAVAAAAVLIAWHLIPTGSSTNRPAAGGPSGRIAFTRITSNRDLPADSDLLVANAGTGAVTPLLEGPQYSLFPVWSPDGSRVAFANGPAESATHLYVMNADGSGLADLGGGTVTIVSWSPDGSKIAYTDSLSTPDNPDAAGVYVIGADGTGRRQVISGNWEGVSWSPDGRRLLLTGWPSNPQNSGVNDLYTVRPDGSDLMQLTNDHLWEHYAVWSPDGTRIAFSRSEGPDDADPTSEIYVMNADGTGITKLTDSPGLDFLPTWSPDGRWIAFASVRGATVAQKQAIADGTGFGGISIWVMAADGSDPRMLVDGGSDVVAPASWAAP